MTEKPPEKHSNFCTASVKDPAYMHHEDCSRHQEKPEKARCQTCGKELYFTVEYVKMRELNGWWCTDCYRAQEKPQQFPEHICRFNDAPQVCECYRDGYEKGKAEPHNTADGYCCACDYDQARFEQKLNANHNGK